MTALLIIFYIIPTLICFIYIYNFWKTMDNNNGFEVAFLIILIIFALLPITDLILAFVISAVYVLRKND